MIEATELQIHAGRPVASLCWQGDTLVDWVGGGNRFHLDGRCEPANVAYSFPFDTAVVSPSGTYSAIFTRLGTKGLLLREGRILRELNRSFYHAHVYEYPLTLFRLSDGRELMAHCPDHYNQLEIDDLATGERLTAHTNRSPSDFFFSRLAATSDGSFLLSAGWNWHPIDHIKLFSVHDSLHDPSHLDGSGLPLDAWADNSSAAFLEGGRLVFHLTDELEDESDDSDAVTQPTLSPKPPFGILRIYDLMQRKVLSSSWPRAAVGTILPVSDTHIVGLFDHPKLFDLKTGEVLTAWPHLKTGKQQSSIIWHIGAIPPFACDPSSRVLKK